MRSPARFLAIAAASLGVGSIAATSVALAQFPHCNGPQITIRNASRIPARLCIKGVGCYDVLAGNYVIVGVPPGIEVPGVAGVANVTHVWEPNPAAPPDLWVPSLSLPATGTCFNIYYDESSCTITMVPAPSPCQNQ